MKSSTPFGPLTGLTYGNGLSLTQSFDTAYRMTAQSIPGVLTLTYPQYDANGNLTTRSDETYTYDALKTASTPPAARSARATTRTTRTATARISTARPIPTRPTATA